MVENETTITISEIFQGHCTNRDLIEPKTTLTLFVKPEELTRFEGILFQVLHPGYFLESGVKNGSFYLTRNKNTVSVPFQRTTQIEDTMFELQWSPDQLSVLTLDDDFREFINKGGNGEDEIEQRKQIIKTSEIFPPSSLNNWARSQDILPKINYDSKDDFLQEVITSIQSIYDSIKSNNTFSAFWDIQYDGKTINKKIPKKEPEIQPTLRLLLNQQANLKNFEVIPEFPTGTGNLDFLVLGVLKTFKQISVCVELKLAHHSKLESGLTKQLPEYMRTKGTKHGIFVILWFKGKDFDLPKKYVSLKDLDNDLHMIRDSKSLTSIRLVFLDMTFPNPPSKK